MGGGGEGRQADKGARGKDVQRWARMATTTERDAIMWGTTKCYRGAIGGVLREWRGEWGRIERACCWRAARRNFVHTGSFFCLFFVKHGEGGGGHHHDDMMSMMHLQRSSLKRRSRVGKRAGGAAAKVRS